MCRSIAGRRRSTTGHVLSAARATSEPPKVFRGGEWNEDRFVRPDQAVARVAGKGALRLQSGGCAAEQPSGPASPQASCEIPVSQGRLNRDRSGFTDVVLRNSTLAVGTVGGMTAVWKCYSGKKMAHETWAILHWRGFATNVVNVPEASQNQCAFCRGTAQMSRLAPKPSSGRLAVAAAGGRSARP